MNVFIYWDNGTGVTSPSTWFDKSRVKGSNKSFKDGVLRMTSASHTGGNAGSLHTKEEIEVNFSRQHLKSLDTLQVGDES